MRRFTLTITLFLVVLFCLACGSSGKSPLIPGLNPTLTGQSQHSSNSGRELWGLWQISLDTKTMQFDIVPMRGVEYTVDVVAFLQKPKGSPANLQVHITDITKWLTEGKMTVNVSLTHPFPGLDQFVGFDVLGVFIGSGSLISQHDPGATYSNGLDDAILLNPDGYTRWFNPTEFTPNGTIMRFVPGNLGVADLTSVGATVNGYKYFADNLGPNENLYDYFQNSNNIDSRGDFTPGNLNTREYMLKLPLIGGTPKLIFQYAVVANWVSPDKTLSGDPDVLDIPGDYPTSANASESFFCNVVDNSNLYYTTSVSGGELHLSLEVFDWAGLFNPGSIPSGIASITLESQNTLIPGGSMTFTGPSLTASPGSTTISSVFNFDIADCVPTAVDGQDILITIEQTSGQFAPNPDLPPVVTGPLSSYVLHTAKVSSSPPGNPFAVLDPNGGEKVPMTLSYEIKWEVGSTPSATVTIEYSKDDFVSDINVIASAVPDTGSFIWDPVPIDPTATAKIRITEDSPGFDQDTSDNYFFITEPVWFEYQPSTTVEEAGVNWHPSWAYDPKDEFSPCIAEDTDGEINVTYYMWEKAQPIYTSDTNVKSTDGITWNGIANYFGTLIIMGDPWCTRADYLKTAPNNIGSAYACIRQNNPTPSPMPYWSSSVDRMVLDEYNDYSFDCGASVDQNSEIASDALGHLYFFSDNDTPPAGISCKRSPNANKFNTPGFPIGMQGATTDTVTSFGEISHVRSWGRLGDGLGLVFFNLSNEVRLAKTTDAPANVTWDDSKVVFNGVGYTEVRDPGMFVDPSGRIHICFVGKNDATGHYDLLYTRADSIDAEFIPPVTVTTSADPINDGHIVFNVFNGYPVVGITFETHGQIFTDLCARDDGTIFLPIHQITADGTNNEDCDIWFVHSPTYTFNSLIVFETGTQPDRRVVLQNADVKTL
jgi:hypothetical protein